MTRATFRCDSCGSPVPLHARRCPRCAKVFDAVRCPQCGHIGDPPEFGNGCPSCGYLAGPRPPDRGRPRRSRFGPVMAVVLVLLAVAVAYAWVLRAP